MSQQSDGTNNPSNPRHEEEDRSLRSILPIPDRRYPGLVVYDANSRRVGAQGRRRLFGRVRHAARARPVPV